MISVQELLQQRSRFNEAMAAEASNTKTSRAETSRAETSHAETSHAETSRAETVAAVASSARAGVAKPSVFHSSRGRILLRQRLGLGYLILGYSALGWALSASGNDSLVWFLVFASAALWGIERARQWHGLVPFLASALVLVSLLLPTWVLGLLALPILGFFLCVWPMKEQTLETAIFSSVLVYCLSVVAASIGAIGLGILGNHAPAILWGVGRTGVGLGLLSLFPHFHRRRLYSYRPSSPQGRLLWKQGQILGCALVGLCLGQGLNQLDWVAIASGLAHALK